MHTSRNLQEAAQHCPRLLGWPCTMTKLAPVALWGDEVRRCGIHPGSAMQATWGPCVWFGPAYAILSYGNLTSPDARPHSALGVMSAWSQLIHAPCEAWQVCSNNHSVDQDNIEACCLMACLCWGVTLKNGCDHGVLHSIHLNSPMRSSPGLPLPRLQSQHRQCEPDLR